MQGLVLGMFNLTVKTIHPFPILRLMRPPDETDEELEANEPAELNAFLRSLGDPAKQGAAIEDMTTADRRALLRWLAGGAAGAVML